MTPENRPIPGRLAGRVAVISGSTGGLGEGIARRLAAEGAAVLVSGRRVAEGETVVESLRQAGADAAFVRADIGQEADCTGLIATAEARWGRLDILVNNAALILPESAEGPDADLWDRIFDVNVRGAWLCCRAAIPIMRRQGGGRIINIGTTLPWRGRISRLAYTCSKGALHTLTHTLARELVTDRILVNWITVGWVATPGELELRRQVGDLERIEARAQSAPLGRMETPEDIAAGVAFLASDDATHITGCDLNISGGLWA
jgi:NAD(P)-dependent dehydrogenase (short-subunit alcohol dehydrogenase family)